METEDKPVPGWPEVKLLRRQRAVAIVLTECAKLAIPKEEFNKLHSENYTKNFHLCIHSPVDDARASRKEIHDIPTAKKIVVFQYRKSGTRCQNPILIYRSSSQQLPFIIPTPVPFGTPERSSIRRLKIGCGALVVHSTHASHCRRRCLLLGDLYNDGLRGGHQG